MEENKKQKAIIVSGYFNPIHKGHLEYFHMARKFADKLIVIVNNDKQRKLKGSKEFMKEDERVIILKELKIVNYVYLSIDNTKDVSLSIRKVYKELSYKYQLLFGNGGDQYNDTIPEGNTCKELNIKLIDGLGSKIQSSSWLLNNIND
ncbi:MAG: adenylyltransferase/cytidyltransferase family protein [Flavobacteriaceae bacterium]|nr:adenylyltransferase/cytidyltransferase family protein [Flavobacteriaceae bacterium]